MGVRLQRGVMGGLCFWLFSCGVAPSSKPPSSGNGAVYGFYLADASPKPGTVSSLPSTVVLFFSAAPLNLNSVIPLTHYNMICGAYTLAATSVDAAPGSAVVTVSFPDLSTFPSGTACTLVVSDNLQSSQGENLEGPRSVEYIRQ